MPPAPSIEPIVHGPDVPPVLMPLPRVRRGWQVFIFYSCAVLLTGVGSMLFADLLWRTGFSPSGVVLLCLFTVLFLLIAVGCMHGAVGFVLRRIGDRRLTRLAD